MSTLRGTTLRVGVELVVEVCCNCGVAFAMPTDFRTARMADKDSFYCPAGHGQSYTQNEADRLRRELEKREQQVAALRAHWDQSIAEIQEQRKEIASLNRSNGQLRRHQHRVHNGVCPHCNRTFQNVVRHMKTQHPTEQETS